MAAAFMSRSAAALRRGFLLVGLLAIVAGFLGMHIMTGLHGGHATTAVTSSTEPAGAPSRTAHGLASHAVAHALQAGTTAYDSMARPLRPQRVPSRRATAERLWHRRRARANPYAPTFRRCTQPVCRRRP